MSGKQSCTAAAVRRIRQMSWHWRNRNLLAAPLPFHPAVCWPQNNVVESECIYV